MGKAKLTLLKEMFQPLAQRLLKSTAKAYGSDWAIYNIGGNLAKLVSSNATTGLIKGIDIPGYLDCYDLVSPVYDAVNVVVHNMAVIPMRILDDENNDISSAKEFTTFYRPNPYNTGYHFTALSAAMQELTGRVFWYLERTGLRITALYLLNSENVEVIGDKKDYIKGYRYRINGALKECKPEDIFYFGNIDPGSDYPGGSRLSSAQTYIELNLKAIEYSRMFFKQGGKLSATIETEQTISDPELRSRLKDEIKQNFSSGVNEMHRVALLDSGFKYNAISLSPKDMEFLLMHKLSANQIAMKFQVPPFMMGDLSDSSVLQNTAEQKLFFWEQCIMPRHRAWKELYDRFLIPLIIANTPLKNKPGIHCEFDYSGVDALQYIKDRQIDRLTKSFPNAGVTPNEIRQAAGLEPIDTPEMNSTYIGFTMAALSVKPPVVKSLPAPSQRDKMIQEATGLVKKIAIDIQAKAAIQTLAKFRRGFENKFRDTTSDLFDKQRGVVIAKLREIGTKSYVQRAAYEYIDDIFDLQYWITEFAKGLSPIEVELMLQAAQLIIDGWSLDAVIDITNPGVQARLGARLKEFSKIQDTTKDAIIAELKAGNIAGEGIEALVNRIDQVFDIASTSRARTIAVTETTYAMRDGEVRDAHSKADGQIVLVGQPFFVGGESLEFPGGGKDAANNINCRCATIPAAEPA